MEVTLYDYEQEIDRNDNSFAYGFEVANEATAYTAAIGVNGRDEDNDVHVKSVWPTIGQLHRTARQANTRLIDQNYQPLTQSTTIHNPSEAGAVNIGCTTYGKGSYFGG